MEIVKRSEERLIFDNDALRREQRSQTSVFGNLQKMMQSMEKQAFEVNLIHYLDCVTWCNVNFVNEIHVASPYIKPSYPWHP